MQTGAEEIAKLRRARAIIMNAKLSFALKAKFLVLLDKAIYDRNTAQRRFMDKVLLS